ncbi:hypothetical protein D3C79_1004510 [compost metagenome]
MKSTELTADVAIEEVLELLKHHGYAEGSEARQIVTDYVHATYPEGKVTVQQGGRFGKVLIRLRDQQMYSRR